MVLVIPPEKHAEHATLLEKSYVMRARIIEHWGWNVPDCDPYRDKDAFDTPETVYFLDLDEETGDVVGTVRFNSTLTPHLLSEVFHDLCSASVPRSPYIWEATRYITDTQRYPDWQNVRSRARLALALNEYAMDNNIKQMSWLTTVPLYRKMNKLWSTTPLGLPEYFEDDDNTYVAAISTFSRRASHILTQRLGTIIEFDPTTSNKPRQRA